METKMEFLYLSTVKQMSYNEISENLGVEKTQLSKWWEELKVERGKISKIRILYNRKKFKKLTFPEFYDWYQSQKKQCYYCGLTENEIKKLIEMGSIKTVRLVTRGRSLELERRVPKPKNDYEDIDNLVLSCYWCNSSKSDEFTEVEFKPIGILFGKIWKNRLKSI